MLIQHPHRKSLPMRGEVGRSDIRHPTRAPRSPLRAGRLSATLIPRRLNSSRRTTPNKTKAADSVHSLVQETSHQWVRVVQQNSPGTDEGWEARTGFSPGVRRRRRVALFASFFPNPSSTREASSARRLDRQLRPVRLPGPLRRSSASPACLPGPGTVAEASSWRRWRVRRAPPTGPASTSPTTARASRQPGTTATAPRADGLEDVPVPEDRAVSTGSSLCANEPSFSSKTRAVDDVRLGFVRRRRPGDAISEVVEDAQERRLGVANGARLDDAIADAGTLAPAVDAVLGRASDAAAGGFDEVAIELRRALRRRRAPAPGSAELVEPDARTVIVPARTCGGGGNRVGRTVRSVRARRTRPGSFQSAVNGRGDPDRGRWRARSAAVVAPISTVPRREARSRQV